VTCEYSAVLGEHILRVFENTVVRIIFGPNRDKVVGGAS
jgi:hypothetical protein